MKPAHSPHSSIIIKTAVSELIDAHIENPEFEAELLLARLLNISKNQLLHSDPEINDTISHQFFALIDKRKTHYPVQYLLGEWEFWSLPLLVPEGVFIPRPETETLIELALEHKIINFSSIIDLGTGSGNISLALSQEFKRIPIVAVDISAHALSTARNNAQLNGMHETIHFVQSDFLNALNPKAFLAPLLAISNPPYIALHEVENLMDEIKLYEPVSSYLADIGGLECYLKILIQLTQWNVSPLYLIFEIAPHLKDELIKRAKEFNFTLIAKKNDLNGNPRALMFRKE